MSLGFSKFVDWIKLSPKYLLGIIFGSSFLLFIPENVLIYLSLSSLVESIRPILSLALIISVALLLGSAVAKFGSILSGAISGKFKAYTYKKRLEDLTEEEKQILKSYLKEDTRSKDFAVTNGVIQGLVQEDILYQSTSLGKGIYFGYNIQPWAWRYLQNNPEVLE